MGETTTAADIDGTGKIVNVRQVLQPNEFYRAQIGTWTKSDVLVNFGRPVETSYFPLMKREVWTYRYLEDNVWYMMYSFYFDDQGIAADSRRKHLIRCTIRTAAAISSERARPCDVRARAANVKRPSPLCGEGLFCVRGADRAASLARLPNAAD